MRVDSERQLAAGSEQLTAGRAAGRYYGLSQSDIITLTGAPRALLFEGVSSTMDVAHEAAANGAPAGTLILAERQRSGRGRGGHSWVSEPDAGVWLTLVERPRGGVLVELMSLRAGLALAPALDRFSVAQVGLKWPNDLYVPEGKLGGVLVEARWRDGKPEWIAIGVGINLTSPADLADSAGLRAGTTAPEVLAAVVPALRQAGTRRGKLSSAELEAFARRDIGQGRRCSQPVPGTVRGINENGELLVESSDGVSAHHSGSLVLEKLR